MTFAGRATILGGLPVWAECWATRGDGWTTDDDSGVETLYWLKRDGTPGKPLPEHMYERLEKQDTYWEVDVVEMVSDYVAHEQWERKWREAIPHYDSCSPDYPEKPKGEPPQPIIWDDAWAVCGDCGAKVDTRIKLEENVDDAASFTL